MSLNDELISKEDILIYQRQKKQKYVQFSVTANLVNDHIAEGWEIDREFKKKVRLKKLKSHDEIFENEVWMLVYSLGFKFLNKNRKFNIPYTDDGQHTKQIDVFAVDDETVLLIECKASKIKNRKQEFKTCLESMHGNMDGLYKSIRNEFPSHKIKYIFATKNYNVGEQDRARMKEFGIVYFDEDKISYYLDLAKHLGHAARFQLLGNLFENQKVKGLKYEVPAISGKMGGHTYYSFSIEPDILLKLGYVLHRTDSNRDSMPTYQRIIKKDRLEKIQNFVNEGGYFPNSIIVSIDSKKKKLRFDVVNQGNSCSLSKIGILHLPEVYKSIYIIDGQHRLYGYANSKYSTSNTIPVVAFENLAQEEQIKLFMDINENQKAVNKNLRNTLDEDLKYGSDDPQEQRAGLALRIARNLGEDRDSALYGRVVIGDNTTTAERCITLETLSKAIRESDFFSKFKNGGIIVHGSFDLGENDKIFDKFYPILSECFNFISESIGAYEWDKTNDDKSSFVKNNVISGTIRVLNSLINHLVLMGEINPLVDANKFINQKLSKYFEIITNYWKNLADEGKVQLSTSYGAGGPIKYCRTFEKEINLHYISFEPEGLKKYWGDRNKEYTNEAKVLIDSLLNKIKRNVKAELDKKFGEGRTANWLSKNTATNLARKVYEYNYGKNKSQYLDEWDFIGFLEIREIMLINSNWKEIFCNIYSFVSNLNNKSDKKESTEWLNKLYEIRKKLDTTSAISSDNFEYIKDINIWIDSNAMV